jgi:transcriptional regulator
MSTTDDLALLKGPLDTLGLKTLSWGPRHGYGIARWIKATSSQALQVEDRALYLALHRLEARRLVAGEWGLSETNRRARYYEITAAGRRHLTRETARWTRYAEAVFLVLHAKAAGPTAP